MCVVSIARARAWYVVAVIIRALLRGAKIENETLNKKKFEMLFLFFSFFFIHTHTTHVGVAKRRWRNKDQK